MQVCSEEVTKAICQSHLNGIVKDNVELGMKVRACNGDIVDDKSTILKVVYHSGRWLGAIINLEASNICVLMDGVPSQLAFGVR